ncbi:hypothetical protein L873DRAFT_1828058 [Choiromyces venosus 120613-1]|uniref:Uncharacterized protein n=1 Tax=Choiromyces venosus 120613-1 TaxID=1336337 RepID=A0A3N4JQ01_9PEZI|nr:hypothetical protein L873DRAFT_1828058 [Choiromyces venosus 120613-1]
MTDLSTAKISPKDMLVKAEYSPDEDTIKAIKDEVYKKIVLYLDIEPAPTDHLHLMEANAAMMSNCSGKKKKIISEDSETGGHEELVVDVISLTKEKYILIVEAYRESLGAAMAQCLLAMKDMGDSNQGGVVYGFVTTEDRWRMLSYDGGSFQVTVNFHRLFTSGGLYVCGVEQWRYCEEGCHWWRRGSRWVVICILLCFEFFINV